MVLKYNVFFLFYYIVSFLYSNSVHEQLTMYNIETCLLLGI